MGGFKPIGLRGIKEAPTFNNNTEAPITTTGRGKPAMIASATGLDVKLATAGAIIAGIVADVNRKLDSDANAVDVTLETTGYHYVTCNTDSDAPVVNGFVVANGSGGVKKSATATNAYCVYVSSGYAWIKLLG